MKKPGRATPKHLLLLSLPLCLPPALFPFFSLSFSAFFLNYPILVTFLLVFWTIIPEFTLNSASTCPRLIFHWSRDFSLWKISGMHASLFPSPPPLLCWGSPHLPPGSHSLFCSPSTAGTQCHHSVRHLGTWTSETHKGAMVTMAYWRSHSSPRGKNLLLVPCGHAGPDILGETANLYVKSTDI